MNMPLASHIQRPIVRLHYGSIAILVGVLCAATLTTGSLVFAEVPSIRSEGQIAEHVKAVWESGAINSLGLKRRRIVVRMARNCASYNK